jgi:hypothetical protein
VSHNIKNVNEGSFYLTDQLLNLIDQIFRFVDRFHRPELRLERVSADRVAVGDFGVRGRVLDARRDLKLIK